MIDHRPEQQQETAECAYWRREGMLRDPFSESSEADCFFSGAGRAELLQDALRMTRFATQTTVFAGIPGVGKTKLLDALVARLAGVPGVLRLQGDFMLSAEQLCGQIGDSLGLQAGDLAPDELRAQILVYLKQSLPLSSALVLLVDDAHELPEDTMAQLLALAEGEGNHIKVLLFVAVDANGELRPELGTAACQRIDIPPLDLDGVEEYLRYRLTDAGYHGTFPFTPTDLLSLLQHSGGVPEHLHDIAEQKLRAFFNQRRQAKSSAQATGRLPIPWLHVAASLGLLLFIGALWTGGDDAAPDQPVFDTHDADAVDAASAPPPRKLPNIADERLPAPSRRENPERDRGKGDDKQALATKQRSVPAPEPAPQSKTRPTNGTATRESVAKTDPAPEKIVVAQPSKVPAASASVDVVEKSAVSRTSAYTSDERYLLSLPASHYTLQLVGSKSLQGVQDFARRHNASDIRIFRQNLNSKPWYVAVTGSFPNQEQATTALTRLPAELRELKPWARPLARVQGDIKSARNGP